MSPTGADQDMLLTKRVSPEHFELDTTGCEYTTVCHSDLTWCLDPCWVVGKMGPEDKARRIWLSDARIVTSMLKDGRSCLQVRSLILEGLWQQRQACLARMKEWKVVQVYQTGNIRITVEERAEES